MADANETTEVVTKEPGKVKKLLSKKGIRVTLRATSYVAAAGVGAACAIFIPKLFGKKGE
jgi:hypothetical protein